jgi:SAM-dependent methyltransferase
MRVRGRLNLFDDHLIEGESYEQWTHTCRAFEFDRMMARVPLGRRSRVLELGSGDGFQLEMLTRRYESVYAIDPTRRPACLSGFAFAMAEALPFPSGAFDLVFSSNVCEHLQDRSRAVNEVVRVLRPGGYFACVAPGRVWKAGSMLLTPVGYPLHVVGKLSRQRSARREPQGLGGIPAQGAYRPGLLEVLKRCLRPEIHGTYPSHWVEYRAFGRRNWIRVLTHPKLVRVTEVPLLSYSPFGLLRFKLIPLRAWLGRHRLATCHGFILQKAG